MTEREPSQTLNDALFDAQMKPENFDALKERAKDLIAELADIEPRVRAAVFCIAMIEDMKNASALRDMIENPPETGDALIDTLWDILSKRASPEAVHAAKVASAYEIAGERAAKIAGKVAKTMSFNEMRKVKS